VGELVVYAPGDNPRRGFFAGYYKDEAATEAAWRGGWLHTGDLARRDETGSFYFVGRRKQVIRRSGENISAREVEVVLEADPDVKEVAVGPVPDAVREEEVFACIVPASGIEAGEPVARAIVARAARKLAYYKVPAYVAFVDELPKTATQKLRYGVVGDLARQLVCEAGRVVDLRDAKRSFRQAG
jgi:acyl-coenzyme A synthetase/AMP-(fatty) acid ligase